MKNLSIDIESYSSLDLKETGVYKYSEAEDFSILLFGYAWDNSEIRVIDLACGEELPRDVLDALRDPDVMKWAFNAQFERVCLSRHLGVWLEPESWRCTMVWAATLGLPLSLEGVGSVLGLEKQKLKEGRELIRYFCSPCGPTRANSGRTRNLPIHAPEKWTRFKEYNVRDVDTERAIKAKITKFPVPDAEWQNYILDQHINDRGIMLDRVLISRAIECDGLTRNAHMEKARSLTGLANPNSTQQLKQWLIQKGLTVESLDKVVVADLLYDATGDVEQVLQLRRELAKSSVKKYMAMEKAICEDGRARGLMQFYGANRTGRYAGRLIQVHNLPQNHLPDLAQVRELVRHGQFEALEMLYDSVPLVLSELIRTAFIPKDGYRFLVADFSAIEARVIAWLAGERWRMGVFATHGKIYEASASQMFHVPIDQVTKGSPLRQKGKVAELACGYGGGVGALKAMGALAMGVQEMELQGLITTWRHANTNIVKLWWDVDRAVKKAVTEHITVELPRLLFESRSGMLFIRLPSGRHLAYVKPRIETGRFGQDAVTYEGVGESKKWQRIESYGPKFVENIIQAIARDLLAEAIWRADNAGYQIVMHVHDEIIVEATPGDSLEHLCSIMAETPKWADGLLLRADGFTCDFYKKD